MSLSSFSLSVKFQVFDLEPYRDDRGRCFDFLRISCGGGSGDQTVRQLCGQYTAAELYNLSFVSDGNFVILKFVSDAKISGRGYAAVFYALDSSGGSVSPSTNLNQSINKICPNTWIIMRAI